MRREFLLFLALLLSSAAFSIAQNEKGSDLFQQAQKMVYEDHDFDGAIRIYDQILKTFASDRALVGRVTTERIRARELGARIEARQEYEKVVRDFPGQPEVIERARRLAEAVTMDPPRHGVYIATFDAQIGAVRGPVARLTEWESFERYPSFSPNGRFIALKRGATEAALDTSGVGAGLQNCACILVIRALKGAAEAAFTPSGRIQSRSDWFPDSTGVLAVVGGSLYQVDRQGTARSLGSLPSAAPPRGAGGAAFRAARQTTLSVDGKTLYMYLSQASGTSQDVERNNLSTSAIQTFDLATSTQGPPVLLPTSLTPATVGPNSGRFMAINPAGDTLALIRRANGPDAHIGLFKTGNGNFADHYYVPNPTSLLIGNVAWTNGGRSIVFSEKAPADPFWRIMQIPATGGEPVFTGLKVADLGSLDVSPDGTQIAFDGTGYNLSTPGDSERQK